MHQPDVHLCPQPLNQSLLCFVFPGLHRTSLVCSRPSVLPYLPVSLAGSVIAAFPSEFQHLLPIHLCKLSCQSGHWFIIPVSLSCIPPLSLFFLGHSWEAC